MKLEIAIFSYNRGTHLQNAVHSIEQCASQVPFFIYDDHSTDPATLDYLASIAGGGGGVGRAS